VRREVERRKRKDDGRLGCVRPDSETILFCFRLVQNNYLDDDGEENQ
jgi:hypothetical protein